MRSYQGNAYRAKRNKLLGCAAVAVVMLVATAYLAHHVVTFWTGSAENWIGVVLATLTAILFVAHAAPLVKAHIEGGV